MYTNIGVMHLLYAMTHARWKLFKMILMLCLRTWRYFQFAWNWKRLCLIGIYIRPPDGPKQPFLYQLQNQVERLPRQDFGRVVVLGDFNLDQKSPQHRDCFVPFCKYFEFIQHSTGSTFRWGGISDLVFDTDQSKQPIDWMPSPWSDHFVLLIEL